MPRKQNKLKVGSQVSEAQLPTTTIISTPKGNWYASKHGKNVDAGLAFLRQLNGDTAMIAFDTAHPEMYFVPQLSTTPVLAQEPLSA